jgi:hypothetical protein
MAFFVLKEFFDLHSMDWGLALGFDKIMFHHQ